MVNSDALVVSVNNVNEKPVFNNPSQSMELEAGVEPPQLIVSSMGATDPEGDTITYAIAGTHLAMDDPLRKHALQ